MEMRHLHKELSVSEQELTIHLKRKLLFAYGVFWGVSFPFLIRVWISVWHSVSTLPSPDAANAALVVGMEIGLLACLLLIVAFGWFSWLGVRPLFSRAPALVISHEGVRVGKLPWMVGNLFIPWEAVRSIYLRDGRRSQYLCVLLKDTDRFVSGLSRMKQFGLHFQMINGAILNFPVSQLWLDRSVEELVQMVSEVHTHELDEYRI